MDIYLVGGAVRDQLLGEPIAERDWVVVGATPQQLIEQGYRQVGKDFPVFLHPKTQEEYALARTERKIGKGYTQFACYAAPDVTLEQDLLRRDLTINAMAQDSGKHIVDPYGGQEDLKNRILRHVSPAFAEDPVRILRVARFAARYARLGFHIAPETLELMRSMVEAKEVDALVPERVWQELQRGLLEPDPQQFFIVLRECGALAVLFPELDQLYGVPNPPKWHPEIDTGIHIELVLKQAALLSPEGPTRFAAALHDIGKGLTPPAEWPSHHGHEEAGVPLVKQLCKRYRAPRDYQALALLVVRYHGDIHRALELRPSTLLNILDAVDAFRRPVRFQQFLLACEADARGRPGFEHQAYPQRERFLQAYQAAEAVSVEPLLAQGLSGAALGQALHQARLKAIKGIL